RRQPLQRRDVAVDQHQRDDQQGRPDRGALQRAAPRRWLDHALTHPRLGTLGRLRAGVDLPVLLLGAELRRVDLNLVPFVVDVDVLVLVPAGLLLPPPLFPRGHYRKGNAAGDPASTMPATTLPPRGCPRE